MTSRENSHRTRRETEVSERPGPSADVLTFDPEALREKYRLERAKRLRPEGNGQYAYLSPEGENARFLEDPWIDAPLSRDPVHDVVDVAIIGAGLGGLSAGVMLKKSGVDRVRVIDKAGDFGGVWYWNRYPGAQCDVESYIYMPFLEETGYIPKEKYAYAEEIREHCMRVAGQYDLYEGACFQTGVTDVRWIEDRERWLVSTDRGDRIEARFVVMAPGGLQQPKLPTVPGAEGFRGHMFHASRWDYAYTGGDSDPDGNLPGLADKVVGVIGTGATSLQCVPPLGASAKHLYVFQRTPNSVSPRNNRPTDPEFVKDCTPGWQHRRRLNFIAATTGGQYDEDLVDDGWTHSTRGFTFTGEVTPGDGGEVLDPEIEDFKVMENVRARVDEIVQDPATAEALKPYYRFFCKRPGFHDAYLPTFNRPNVTLVDTNGRGVERFTETAVVVDGQEYEVDCLVFATGFDTGNGYLHGKGYDVVGRDGISLTSSWADGMQTYHGFFSKGFPNCLFMGSTQTGVSVNYAHTLTEQAEHVAYVVSRCIEQDIRTIEPTEEAQAAWVASIHAGWTPSRKQFALDCTPSFFNNEGRPLDPNGHLYNYVGSGVLGFFEMLAAWRAEGRFSGLDVVAAEAELLRESAAAGER